LGLLRQQESQTIAKEDGVDHEPQAALTIARRTRQLVEANWQGAAQIEMQAGVAMSAGSKAGRRSGTAAHRDRGLLVIGVFKLLEAVFFALVGFGVLHFLHRDIGDAAVRLAERLRMDVDGRLMTWVLDHLDDITAHRLKVIGAATFFYAGLRVTEGVGLVLQKLWAEYLTIGVTVSFLPWEMYEIFRKPDMLRLGLLVINFAVLIYLAWSLDRRNRRLGRT
jgi:uncharacterized membrane protein (DUF2068 family)